MSLQATISCRISSSGPGLQLQAILDDRTFFDGDPGSGQIISVEVPNDDGQHCLVFQLSGKTWDHTKVDAEGNVLEDVTVTVEDVTFDDIKLGHLLVTQAVYEHDSNGTNDLIQDKFYGVMGCNGRVKLAFTTPIYLWLLENM